MKPKPTKRGENNEIISNISDTILRRLPKYYPSVTPRKNVGLTTSGWQVKYWSFICQATLSADNWCRTLYVKIPKADRAARSIAAVASEPRARRMAQEEYNSLQLLNRLFSAHTVSGCHAIKPLDYLEQYNAIITEQVEGQDLYLLIRRELAGRRHVPDCHDLVRLCGKWLRHFHDMAGPAELEPFQPSELRSQIRHSAERIRPQLTSGDSFHALQDRFSRTADSLSGCPVPVSATVPGFEVRNVLVSRNSIYVLDPGGVAMAPIYEDLARFLVSLDILYWGGPSFLLRPHPPKSYSLSFLSGYFGTEQFAKGLLILHKIVQLMRQWDDAYLVVDFKRYFGPVDGLVRRLYVDRYYSRAVQEHLTILEDKEALL